MTFVPFCPYKREALADSPRVSASASSMFDFQHVEQADEAILPVKAGVRKIAPLVLPLCKPPVIISFFRIFDDEIMTSRSWPDPGKDSNHLIKRNRRY